MKVFISYRRDDSAGYAHALYDRQADHFGEDNVFMDVDTLRPGVDFRRVIEERVQSSNAMIVLIGRDWTNATDAAGNRRLDDPRTSSAWRSPRLSAAQTCSSFLPWCAAPQCPNLKNFPRMSKHLPTATPLN